MQNTIEMKDFVKMMLAVICGIMVLSIVSSMICMVFVGLMAVGSAGNTAVVPASAVLRIDLNKLDITEQTVEDNPLSSLSSLGIGTAQKSALGIWDAVQAINTAAGDPAIKCIYILSDNNGCNVATLQELRKSIDKFRKSSGKPVISYIESPTTGSYYLSSVSDKVYMTSHPGATTMLLGVNTTSLYLGDLLHRLGINVQLIRHGKYKAAGETFVRSSSSLENKEQMQRMVDSIWDVMSSEIAESRGIDAAQLDSAVDNLELCLPEDFVNAGLVDELVTREGREDKLCVLAGVEKYEDVKFVGLKTYASARLQPSVSKKKIAVIYADGEIVDESSDSNVSGGRFASIVKKVCADSTVKAVVLRVNSPGGSVLASEKIKAELDLLKAQKPVVASYGEYAASGGYWISAGCDRIFSDAVTLTGSIGVFSMIPDLSGTLEDLAHVGLEYYSSNNHGDMYSLTRALDKKEYDYMLRSVEDIYDRFTSIVSEGRGLPVETVDEIGQGRIWTGSDALTINLVDEIGTLEDAICYAAILAGDPEVSDWKVTGYPKPKSELEELMSLLSGKTNNNNAILRQFEGLQSAKYMARMPFNIEVK